MSAIIRIDKAKSKKGGNTHGWQVRLPTGEARKYKSKLFSDGVHGSKGKALVAAEEYLEAYLKEHPEQDKLSNPPYSKVLQERNKSGKTGVYRSHDKNQKKAGEGPKRYFWGAFIPTGPYGTRFTKSFYIDEYGSEEEAMAHAIDFRKLWEEAVNTSEEAVREFFQRYHFDEIRERGYDYDPSDNFW